MKTTIDMAREASNTPPDHHATPDLFGVSQLERFAALVREDEREACALVCETYNKRQCYNNEDMAVANECAAAIRNRGNT